MIDNIMWIGFLIVILSFIGWWYLYYWIPIQESKKKEEEEHFFNFLKKKKETKDITFEHKIPHENEEWWLLSIPNTFENEQKWWIGKTHTNEQDRRTKIEYIGCITYEKNKSDSYRDWKWFITSSSNSEHTNKINAIVLYEKEKERFQWIDSSGNPTIVLEIDQGYNGRILPIVEPFFESIHMLERGDEEDRQWKLEWKDQEIGETLYTDTIYKELWDMEKIKEEGEIKDGQRWMISKDCLKEIPNIVLYGMILKTIMESVK
jgi:hypothetical protein